MSDDQIKAAAFAVLAVLVPLIVGVLRLLTSKVALAQLDVEAARRERLAAVARGAVLYAEEQGEAGKLPGEARAKLANDVVAGKFPKLDADDVELAVKTAVAETPGVGATGKKDGKN